MDNMQHMDHSYNFLKKVNHLELVKRIQYFRNLDKKNMSYSEIFNELLTALCIENQFVYITQNREYLKGTKFFRVRRLEGSFIPNDSLKIEQDFWNKPAEFCDTLGRLNKVGESLLYTSPNPIVSIKETKIQPNEYYCVIEYEAKENIKVNIIGGHYDYEGLQIYDEKLILANEIMNDFLRDEFSRDVGVGTEHLYQVSELIAKSFFDLPPRIAQDAWAYSSTQSKTDYNVCFRPEIAKEVLELKGALICCDEKEISDSFSVRAITPGIDQNGQIHYYPIGSPEQREHFPGLVFGHE